MVGSFTGGLASGLAAGFELGSALRQRAKEDKREKIAAEVANEKTAADGVPTFAAHELAQQERLNPTLAEGMSGNALANYASTRRVPLAIENSQALETPEPNLGGLPKVDINAPKPRPAALPQAKPDEAPEVVVTGRRPSPKMDFTNAPSVKDEIAAPQYHKYTDMFGNERFTTELRPRSKEEVAFETATRLQKIGDTKGYDEYMQRYDTELERSSKVRAKTLMESSQTLQAGILMKDPAKVNKGLSGIMNTLQGNPDGMTWNLQRSPDGNELVLSAIDTATGLPAPPQIKGYPAGTMAVFKADPTAGLSAEEVMAGQMSALAKGDFAGYTKQIMEGRKAIAEIHQSEASARFNNVKADLAPAESAAEIAERKGRTAIGWYEANTGRMNAVSNRISALGNASGVKGSLAPDNYKFTDQNGQKFTIPRYRFTEKNSSDYGYVYPGIAPEVPGQDPILRPEYGEDGIAIQNIITRGKTLGFTPVAGIDGRLFWRKPNQEKLTHISVKAIEQYGNRGHLTTSK